MRTAPASLFLPAMALLVATACSSSSGGGGTTGAGGTSAAPTSSAASSVATGSAGGGSAPAAATSPTTLVVSSSPSASASTVPAPTVNMTDANQFVPTTLTIARGTTVTWVNVGQTAHTVTDDPTKAQNPSDAVLPAGAQPWDSGTIAGGASYSHTFDTPGQYTYLCIPHEALGMIARVTVSG